MKNFICSQFSVIVFMIMPNYGELFAAEIRVAAASNFAEAIKDISKKFEANTGDKVTLIFGSTGKHYAQILNGAPFDAFFAADVKRPELLEKKGVALSGSRFTYAIGKIVLWSPEKNYVDPEGKILEQKTFHYLALANPKLAPYGEAAQEVLRARGLWKVLVSQIVRGENIGQTFQFVKSGNAELGFVSFSQIKDMKASVSGSFWRVPQRLYSPIKQQAVLLKDSDVARSFLSFMKREDSLAIIRQFGYGTP